MNQEDFQSHVIHGLDDLSQRMTTQEELLQKHLLCQADVDKVNRRTQIIQYVIVPILSGGVVTALVSKFINLGF